MKLDFDKRIKNSLFFAILLVYAITLIHIAYKINISEDETYTLNTTSRSLIGVIKQSYYFEAQPPVYFILFSWWRHIYHTLFFAKLFSIICVGFSSYFFYKLVKLTSGREFAKWMVFIFLLNPFTIWAALFMRTYALLLLLSTIAINYFFRYYIEEKKSHLYTFLIVSFIGMYTQYFFTFVVAVLAFQILVFKGWKKFFSFFVYLIPLILFFLPNLVFLPNQIEIQESYRDQHFALNMIDSILHTPQNFLLGIHLIPDILVNRLVRIIFIIVVIFGYLNLFKKQSSYNAFILRNYNMILLSICMLVPMFCAGFVFFHVVYADNYLVLVFPMFIFLFTIFQQYPLVVSKILYATLTIYFIVLSPYNYIHPVKTHDYLSTAEYIEKIEKPGEPVLIYKPALALPFNNYYKGKNIIIPIPHPVEFDANYLVNMKDTFELKNSIENINTTSKSYLLMSDTTIYQGNLDMHRKMVDDYLREHYTITLDTLFYGWSKNGPLRIRRFEKK